MDERNHSQPQSVRLNLYGIVQGVGFRPYAARLARRCGIGGYVKNSGGKVEILATGLPAALDAFTRLLLDSPPPNALIVHHDSTPVPAQAFAGFAIVPSDDTAAEVFLSPDLPICDHCLRELFDPQNERYRYPMISCMSCGPRYSIIEDAPYDRDATTMRDIALCPRCWAEYLSSDDRRYHAQTISCDDCGLSLLFARGEEHASHEEALTQAVCALKGGGIVAVKGIGGYHLACSPYDQAAVLRLRGIKQREGKPLAVMFADAAAVRRVCAVSAEEEALLTSAARPIVLLAADEPGFAPAVCAGSHQVGAFVAYTPLQALLLQACGALVMTSANLSHQPILRDDAPMLAMPGPDGVLYHKRRISVGLDDSVARITAQGTQVIRRARGYAPLPVVISRVDGAGSVFAAGGHQKAAFCVTSGPFAYVSEHLGDLDNEACMAQYAAGYARMKRIFRLESTLAVCDMHPAYPSADFARGLGLPVLPVQHHHAHIASVMAEHGLTGPVIGVAFDGTGYGTDGAVWGSEFLLCRDTDMQRVGHLAYVRCVGGDESMRDATKSALFHLYAAGLEARIDDTRWPVLKAALQHAVGAYDSASMGRLFDAVSCLTGTCAYNQYEGQCAMELESRAARAQRRGVQPYPLKFSIARCGDMLLADAADVIAAIAHAGPAEADALALGFHRALADMTLAMCRLLRRQHGVNDVALSGGVFQNGLLLDDLLRKLNDAGFRVYINHGVPPNDGGICLGQAYLGGQYQLKEGASCASQRLPG
ncbi:MAG: carbamoyltransferase HypF [Eubacteriales bacterium]|nr:carbamoyltransferase HypF [Eubacteriales bacterium]